jgi:hypothetical protein
MLELMDYPLRIEYIPGAVNEVADALSRLLDTTPADVATSIEVQDAVADALRHANETTVSSAQFQTDWELVPIDTIAGRSTLGRSTIGRNGPALVPSLARGATVKEVC